MAKLNVPFEFGYSIPAHFTNQMYTDESRIKGNLKGKKVKAVCGSYSILYSYPNKFLHSSPEALHTPSGVRDLC